MPDPDTDRLIELARYGDTEAGESLLGRHRSRLRCMVAVFLDPRLSSRLDPSDIVQEALTVAAKRLPVYLESRPIPFYPWLRQFVHNELANIHRRHVLAQRRSVGREERPGWLVSDASALQMADRLMSREPSPSQHLQLQELKDQIKTALARLSATERELLLMRCAEHLSISEISDVLGISPSAARSRITRALQKLNQHLRAGA
jgi:RNA polymerase sigma-70 factor (ECF subfamily)